MARSGSQDKILFVSSAGSASGVTGMNLYSRQLLGMAEETHEVERLTRRGWVGSRNSRRPGLAVVDHLRSARLLPPDLPYLYCSHNCETAASNSLVDLADSHARRVSAAIRAKRIRAVEEALVRHAQCRLVTAVTEEDAARLRALGAKKVEVLPPVAPPSQSMRPVQEKRVVLVGSMRWWVKRANARWLIREVMPLAKAAIPDVQLVVAGTEASRLAALECESVALASDFTDTRDVYEAGGVFVVPERQLGGLKLKTLEAASWGAGIVATSAGAEGAGLVHRVSYLQADTPQEMAGALVELLADEAKRLRLGRAAQAAVAKTHSPRAARVAWNRVVGAW